MTSFMLKSRSISPNNFVPISVSHDQTVKCLCSMKFRMSRYLHPRNSWHRCLLWEKNFEFWYFDNDEWFRMMESTFVSGVRWWGQILLPMIIVFRKCQCAPLHCSKSLKMLIHWYLSSSVKCFRTQSWIFPFHMQNFYTSHRFYPLFHDVSNLSCDVTVLWWQSSLLWSAYTYAKY